LLFTDERLVSGWANGGSVRRPTLDPDKFASAKSVIEAAAISLLEEAAPGFDLLSFHTVAY
jgi:hypothetical protein